MESYKLFSAVWCSNCQPLKKMIEERGYSVEVIDVDNDPAAVRDYGVRGVPCLVLSNGVMVSGTDGIMKKLLEVFGEPK